MHISWRNTARGLRLSAYIFLVTAAALVVLWVAINAFDVSLSAEAQQLLQVPDSRVKDADNAFYTAYAFGAAEATDLQAEGRRRVALIHAAMDQHQPLDAAVKDMDLKRLEFAGKDMDLCVLAGGPVPPYGCLQSAAAHAASIKQSLADNAELVRRYRALIALPGFDDVLRPRVDAPVVSWGLILKAKRLLDSDLALRADAGDVEGALHELADDAAFWDRVVHAERLNLLDDMIAIKALASDYILASDLLRVQKHLADKPRHLLGQILDTRPRLNPLVFRMEFLSIANTLDDDAGLQAWFDSPAGSLDFRIEKYFLLKHATLNRAAPCYAGMEHLARVPYGQFLAARQAAADLTPRINLWDLMYDPAGMPGTDFDCTAYTRYSARAIDAEGIRRLLALQFGIVTGPVQDSEVQRFVDMAAPDEGDPYTGEPMHWDAAQHRLSFDAQGNWLLTWLPVRD